MRIVFQRAKARLTVQQRDMVIDGLSFADRGALLKALARTKGPDMDYALEHAIRVRSIGGAR